MGASQKQRGIHKHRSGAELGGKKKVVCPQQRSRLGESQAQSSVPACLATCFAAITILFRKRLLAARRRTVPTARL